MIKVTSRHILGLMGSFTVATPSSAHHINIHFENGESFYTSPVVYLTGVDGQIPKIAMKDGIQTTGGVDENENDLTEFSSVTFEANQNMDNIELKIIPISDEEPQFCKVLNFSSEGNKILLPATFPKLKTSITCNFKIRRFDRKMNRISKNKMTFIFNYTLKGWLSDLGKETEAKKTAEIIKETNLNATNIAFYNQNIIDLSPFTGFIHTQILGLNKNKIRVIPDSIGNLTKLQQLYLSNNQIKIIPDVIKNLKKIQYLNFSTNKIRVIPHFIGNLTNLQQLNFSRNLIENIPNSFENFANLNYLVSIQK